MGEPGVRVGTAAGEPYAVTLFGAHLFCVRYFQGRSGERVEQSLRGAGELDSRSGWRAGAALALIEGRPGG